MELDHELVSSVVVLDALAEYCRRQDSLRLQFGKDTIEGRACTACYS